MNDDPQRPAPSVPESVPEEDPAREHVIRDPDAPGRGLDETDDPIPEPNEPA